MKKIIIFIFSILLIFTACSETDENTTVNSSSSSSSSSVSSSSSSSSTPITATGKLKINNNPGYPYAGTDAFHMKNCRWIDGNGNTVYFTDGTWAGVPALLEGGSVTKTVVVGTNYLYFTLSVSSSAAYRTSQQIIVTAGNTTEFTMTGTTSIVAQ